MDTSRQNTASQILDKLTKDILQGVYLPNDKLQIKTLKDRYNVGTSPLREALSQLIAKDLVVSENTIKWTINDKYPLRRYKYDNNNKEGAIEIYEKPKLVNGVAMKSRYIGGIDPYDDDSGTSLGSIFIFDMINDVIVAEYTGRPKFANDFYEICRRLLLYYNAEALYENNKKGLFTYFSQ